MSNSLKSFIMFFTLLCVFVLIIFSVELVMLNRKAGGDDGSAPRQSGSTPSGNADGPESPPANTDDIAGSAPTGDPSPLPPPPPSGKRYELPMPDDVTLVLYAEEDIFEHEVLSYSDMFTYKGAGDASLEVCLAYMKPSAEVNAVKLLNGYTDNEAAVEGLVAVGRSSIKGVHVSAIDGEYTYDAWICFILDNDQSEFGVSFALIYQNKEQKDALYSILDTMGMIQR